MGKHSELLLWPLLPIEWPVFNVNVVIKKFGYIYIYIFFMSVYVYVNYFVWNFFCWNFGLDSLEEEIVYIKRTILVK